MEAPFIGHWGVPTSTVDWCEANYAHTRYVCELFNSASSVAMVLAGLLGVALNRRALAGRFLLGFGMLSVVGLGSVAFHATLRFEHQMLDELPMLYLVLWMVFVLVEDRAAPRFGAWFPASLVLYAALLTYLCAFTRGRAQFFTFQLSFGSLELFSLLRVYWLQRRSSNPNVRRLFRWGMGAYLLAIVSWFVDVRFCDALSVTLPSLGVPNPQLHAWWHVLVSCGFYLLLLSMALLRAEALGQPATLGHCGALLPRLSPAEPAPPRAAP